MLSETENTPKAYSLDIQLNIGLNIHHVLYIFGVCVKRILKFVMRHELTKEKGRCHCEKSSISSVFNDPIPVISKVLTMLLQDLVTTTEICSRLE
jgi:hypothetical protein